MQLIGPLYLNIKSRIKYDNSLSERFSCFIGAPQGDCMSPFIFAMYVNDLEDYMSLNEFDGVDMGMLKLFLLLYADDIVLFAESECSLQNGLEIRFSYCEKWKLSVKVKKTNVMIFRKNGKISKKVVFKYNGNPLEIVKQFTYLCISFSSGGSFQQTFDYIEGQALKAVLALKQYLTVFKNITISHTLELFDKLILPILNYGVKVWGFSEAITRRKAAY